jgi:hypothetical protein
MSSQHLAIDNTFGAGYIGVLAASFLYGVSCLQAWYYFTHQNDGWSTKALVSAVMTFDTIHQALISHALYTYLVTNFGNVASLENIVWSLVVEVLISGLTALLVQSFLTARVWRLSNRNVWLTGLALMLVVGEFVCVVVFTGMSFRLHSLAQVPTLKPLSIMVNALAAAGDVLIAATMCILLHKSRTGFHKSDTMINKLILFAINTGFITSLCAVASLISIAVAGGTFIYIAFFFCIGRFYSNSLLATLNARGMIRNVPGRYTTDNDISIALGETPNRTIGSSHTNDISVKIDTTKEVSTDRDSDREQDNTRGRRCRSSTRESTIITTPTGHENHV